MRHLIARAVGLAVLALAGCSAGRAPTTTPAPEVPPQAPSSEAPPAKPEPLPAPEPAPEPGLEAVAPVVLPAPLWAYALADETGRRALTTPTLVKLSETRNEITDEDAWLARYGLDRPGEVAGDDPGSSPGQALADVPFAYQGVMLLHVLRQPDGVMLLVYGEPSAGRYLVGVDEDGVRFAYDFAAYLRAPAPTDEPAYTEQGITWAALVGDWLYVQTNHLTYAAESGGQNGYVTALDAGTGALRWRSRPLVANARTFEAVGDALVTGYGFTAEPDFLFVLDRFTGEVRSETRLKTAAEWIVRQGERLLVRAYDTDYEFALR